ncbi:hypothetical protein GIB67_003156, partial [Kingdonia uniflora]
RYKLSIKLEYTPKNNHVLFLSISELSNWLDRAPWLYKKIREVLNLFSTISS